MTPVLMRLIYRAAQALLLAFVFSWTIAPANGQSPVNHRSKTSVAGRRHTNSRQETSRQSATIIRPERIPLSDPEPVRQKQARSGQNDSTLYTEGEVIRRVLHDGPEIPEPIVAPQSYSYEASEPHFSHCDSACDAMACAPPVCRSRTSCWAYGEFINWWSSGMDAPALVTTSITGTDRVNAGVLGQTGSSTLFGGDLVEGSSQGGRFGLGWKMDRCNLWECNLEFLFLADNSDTFAATSQGNPILARPFFNVETNLQASNLVAFPNFITGSVQATAGTELSAWDVMFVRNLPTNGCYQSQLLLGYRGASLDEFIHISDSTISQNANTGTPVGTAINSFDNFDVENRFNGFTLGHRLATADHGVWNLQLVTKIALGFVDSDLQIRGQTVTTQPNTNPVTITGGLLALPSNIGTYSVNRFAMLPEFSLNGTCQLNSFWSLRLGYTLHYWSQAMRPGTIIDPNVNTSQLPPGPINGAAFPQERLTLTDYLAQGINVGLVATY